MKPWKILCCIALVAGLIGLADFASLPLRADVLGDKPEITVLTQNSQEVQFEIKLPLLERVEGILDGKKWDRIEIPGGGYGMDLGAPEVPHYTRLLIIPATAGVKAQFEALETTTIPNVLLMPAQGKEPEDIRATNTVIRFDEVSISTK